MISHPLATTPPRAASFRRYPVSTPWPRPAATASLVAALPHRGRPRDTRPAASGQPASPPCGSHRRAWATSRRRKGGRRGRCVLPGRLPGVEPQVGEQHLDRRAAFGERPQRLGRHPDAARCRRCGRSSPRSGGAARCAPAPGSACPPPARAASGPARRRPRSTSVRPPSTSGRRRPGACSPASRARASAGLPPAGRPPAGPPGAPSTSRGNRSRPPWPRSGRRRGGRASRRRAGASRRATPLFFRVWLFWSERSGQVVGAYPSWMRARTPVTCRTARVARLRPPRQFRSPRHVLRSVGRRGRGAVRLEVRRCGQWVRLAVLEGSERFPPTEARVLRRAVAGRGTRARE
jgi:hypothetical protein